jgi:hypothetical protein
MLSKISPRCLIISRGCGSSTIKWTYLIQRKQFETAYEYMLSTMSFPLDSNFPPFQGILLRKSHWKP